MCIRDSTCHVQPPWSASTDFKLSGSYRLRGDVQVSAAYQNSPGIPTLAIWNAPNSAIAPVLGRNLSSCRAGLTAAQCTASLAIALVPTNSLYREPVSYTHLRAHETPEHLVCR